MKVLVLGASGATGRLVVSQLLERNIAVKIVVREGAKLPEGVAENNNSSEVVKGSVDDFTVEEIRKLMMDCDAAVCCLGHNISFHGIFGRPRRLVVNAVRKITEAMATSSSAKKLILMSTTAYTNKSLGEKSTAGEKFVFSLLEIILPPHKDNMLAGDHLIYEVGQSEKVEWTAVRPDSLFDEESTSEYEIFDTKIRSPLFNAGKTSRINVSHFMVELLLNDALWQKWKYKTPVIYNKE